MPRTLNAKQAATANDSANGIVVSGRPYILYNAATGQQVSTTPDGVLTTGPGRFELWIFTAVPSNLPDTFTVWASGSAKYVVDGRRPDPVKTGPSGVTPVTVHVSSRGGNFITLEAPNADLAWTLVGDHIEYLPRAGLPTQLWRIGQ